MENTAIYIQKLGTDTEPLKQGWADAISRTLTR